jgi:hypothetical protein
MIGADDEVWDVAFNVPLHVIDEIVAGVSATKRPGMPDRS